MTKPSQSPECNQCNKWRAQLELAKQIQATLAGKALAWEQECADLMRERKRLRDALREILDEAEGDFDCDIIITAARGALEEDE